MPFKHGKSTSVWLDVLDLSVYFNDAALNVNVDTAETSTFTATFKTFVEGVAKGEVNFKGYYDSVNDATLATTLRNGGSVLTYAPAGALAIGDLARLVSVHSTKLDESSPVGGAVLMDYSAQGDGIVGYAAILHTLAAADVGTTTGAGLDGLAATTTGWHMHTHVTAVTGSPTSWTIKLQDSTDNITFADVTGATSAGNAPYASRLAGAALNTTLRRYTRYVATVVGGTAPTVTFGLAVSRN
jgi:hypothetical protein